VSSAASPSDADPWLDAAQDFRAPLLVLALLAVLAGYADAVALLQWDVFVANQSGNMVRTGMGLAGAYTEWQLALVSVVSFGLGGAASFLLGRRRHRVTPPALRLSAAAVALVVWVLVVALAGRADDATATAAIAVLAFGMGVIATTFVRLGGVQVTTTYATGAVLRVGQGLVRSTEGPRGRTERRMLAVTMVMLVSYGTGGALGTAAVSHLDRVVRTLPAVAIVVTVALLLRRVRRADPPEAGQQG
jgi:uncharacterized membrane protein YoaK (UPF0700 family)